MSAIIDHAVFDTKARTRHPAEAPGNPRARRNSGWLSTATWQDYRKHGAIEVDKESCGRRVARSAMIRKVAGWIWRQVLGFDAACKPADTRAAFTRTPFW